MYYLKLSYGRKKANEQSSYCWVYAKNFSQETQILMFDSRDLSEDDVQQILQQKPIISDDRFVVMRQEQFLQVFRSLGE